MTSKDKEKERTNIIIKTQDNSKNSTFKQCALMVGSSLLIYAGTKYIDKKMDASDVSKLVDSISKLF